MEIRLRLRGVKNYAKLILIPFVVLLSTNLAHAVRLTPWNIITSIVLPAGVSLNSPRGLATDSLNRLYIANTGANNILRFDPASNSVTPLFGGTLNVPEAVAVQSSNTIVADTGNHRILQVTGAGAIVQVAGTGMSGNTGDGATATSARLNRPRGVVQNTNGNYYIADTDNNRIRQVNSATAIISNFAGDPNGIPGNTNGVGDMARFNAPQGMAILPSSIIVADTGNNLIRRIDLATQSVSMINSLDAVGAIVIFNTPTAVAFGPPNDLFVADQGNNLIRLVDLSTNQATIIAGGGTGVVGSSNIPASTVALNSPTGVAVDTPGNLYISETGGNRIRKVDVERVNITSGAGQITLTENRTYTQMDGVNSSQIDLRQFQLTFGKAGGNSFSSVFNGNLTRNLTGPATLAAFEAMVATTGGGAVFRIEAGPNGVLTLGGNNTNLGNTAVNSGELKVLGTIANGIVNSPVTINANGRLSGNGTLANVINHGTIKPGNSIGTITINGNYTQTGTYELELDSNGTSDRINVTGTASLGGTLTVLPLSPVGTFIPGTIYTILTAANVNGTFQQILNPNMLKFHLIYSGTQVQLVMNGQSFAGTVANNGDANASSIAQYLDGLQVDPASDLGRVLTLINGLGDPAAIAEALSRIQPNALVSLSDLIYALSHRGSIAALQEIYAIHTVDQVDQSLRSNQATTKDFADQFVAFMGQTSQSVSAQLDQVWNRHPQKTYDVLTIAPSQQQLPHDLRVKFGKANFWLQQTGHYLHHKRQGPSIGVQSRSAVTSGGID